MKAITGRNWQRNAPIFWEHEGSRAMRDGQWKIVSEVGRGWEIYNMDEDRTELTNLVETESSRLTAMESSYEDWARRCEVEAWPVPPLTWNPKMRAPHAHRSA